MTRGALDKQELRIALVMNGGVSLAVWMGGVTRELDRVRLADGVYGQLLELTQSTARIDVIAGASAGGINGAVLALGIAKQRNVADIRDLWMKEGAIEDLLRDPLEKDALSVLQGDGHLLTGLSKAMKSLSTPGNDGPPGAPVDLTITGTTLSGEVTGYADIYGSVIPDVDHKAQFRFRRKPDDQIDDFADAGVAAQLALAARSTASFPGAFEPSFVPVGEDGGELHPDMQDVANFRENRWVIDGGVLVNTPFRPALDAIRALPAESSVRRVLGYVVPQTSAPPSAPDDRTQTHTALEVGADAISRLPRVQSVGRELREIEDSNAEVHTRRYTRAQTLIALGPEALESAAAQLYPAYVRIRQDGAATQIVAMLLAGTEGAKPTSRQVAALREAIAGVDESPWAPAPLGAAGWAAVGEPPWRWGFAPVEHAGNVALQLVREADEARAGAPDNPFNALRGAVHEQLARLRAIERDSRGFWRARAAEGLVAHPEQLPAVAVAWKNSYAGLLAAVAQELANVVNAIRATVLDAVPGAPVAAMLDTLASDPALTVRRLLALDVVQRSTGADLRGVEQAVELVLLSADTPCVIDPSGRSKAAKKLAGLQVHHFGGFYKRSWRANDWMWGRLDGADRLVRMLLDPQRVLLRLGQGVTVPELVNEIKQIALGPAGSKRDWLEDNGWDEAQVHDQLVELQDPTVPVTPAALHSAHEAITRRVQLDVLYDEIPNVRDAVAKDLEAKAASDSKGAKWAKALPAEPMGPAQIVAALSTCDIGQEDLLDDAGSDHFTKVTTTAGAVLGSVAGGSAPKAKLLTAPVAWVRGMLLAVYLLGRGVIDRSRTESFLVALVLGVAGALVGLLIVGVPVPGLLWLPAATLLIAAVVLSVIRGLVLRLVFVVGVFVVTAAGFWAIDHWAKPNGWSHTADAIAPVIAVTLMVLAPMLLGLGARRK